jgi:hypothetical protein
LEDSYIEGRIIFRWIFRKWDRGGGGMEWIDLAQDRDRWQVTVNGNELSGSIKCEEFLD